MMKSGNEIGEACSTHGEINSCEVFYLTKIECGGVDWTHLAQDGDR
jgi:hypothetical protein